MRDFQQLKVLLKSLCKDKSVFAVILLSAFLVTAVRLVTPFRVGKDQAVQLEASQRLVRGLGLTTTKAYPNESNDILVAPSSKYLTHWPPGFSLLVATFLYAGLPLLIALKILYAPIGLIGWIGWATIASNFFVRPATYGKAASYAHLIILALLPLVATPKWEGTDIFLWAGIPIIFLCLIGVNKNKPSLLTISSAGFLFGCLVAIRFTSLFIGLAALLILFQVSYPHIKVFLKRYCVFLFSASIIILPTVIYLTLYNERVTSAGPVVDIPYVFDYGYLINGIVKNLIVISTLVVGHPLVEMVVYKMNRGWFTYVAGLISLTVVLAWPLLLWRGAGLKSVKAKDDLALNFSFLPISLVVFLIAAALYLLAPDFIQVRRYYEVLSLSGIFIFYAIATRPSGLRIAKMAAKGVLLSFILYVCVVAPAQAYINNRRQPVDSNAHRARNSGMLTLYTPRENSRIKVEQLYRDNPEALFYAQYYQWFTYDGLDRLPPPGIGMRALPKPEFWTRAYASRPVKVFWILDQNAEMDSIPDGNKRLVYSNSDEEIVILESDFSSGPLVSEHVARDKSLAIP